MHFSFVPALWRAEQINKIIQSESVEIIKNLNAFSMPEFNRKEDFFVWQYSELKKQEITP